MGVSGAAQLLCEQTRPREHAFVQDPQWFASEERSKHPSGQLVCPAEQVALQFPFRQDFPTGQAFPHRPQLLLSVRRFVHWLLQSKVSAEQTMGLVSVGFVVMAVVRTVAVTGRMGKGVVVTGIVVSVSTMT
jgi:hypothetical protein